MLDISKILEQDSMTHTEVIELGEDGLHKLTNPVRALLASRLMLDWLDTVVVSPAKSSRDRAVVAGGISRFQGDG